MKNQEKLILNRTDFHKLCALVGAIDSGSAELLEEELGRASVVADGQLPADVVAMNSKVGFKDLDTAALTVVTLVYPHEAKIEEHKISVLAPVGSALIGLRVGQVIDWPLPGGKKKRLQVTSVS